MNILQTEIKNYTVFQSFQSQFGEEINIFIGENGQRENTFDEIAIFRITSGRYKERKLRYGFISFVWQGGGWCII